MPVVAAEEIPTSGIDGGVYWEYDAETTTLTLSPTTTPEVKDSETGELYAIGEMKEYKDDSRDKRPWIDTVPSITTIVVEDGVTLIGRNSFYGCTSLQSVTLPNSLTLINKYAFSGCTALQSINVPNSVTQILNNAFYGCTSLQSVTLSEGLGSISASAFSGCTSLQSITIPNSVTSLGGSVFRGCTGLTTATLGSGITTIGSDTFNGCTSLETVECKGSMTKIGDRVFNKCENLVFNMPKSVTTVGTNAFDGCKQINGDLSHLKSIGSTAFANIKEPLGDIIIADDATISVSVFSGSKLTSLEFNAANLPNNGLLKATILSGNIVLGDTVKEIYETLSAWKISTTLAEVEFIEQGTLTNAEITTDISIPNGATLEPKAFIGTTLKKVTYDANTIPERAFSGVTAEFIKLGGNVKTLATKAFSCDKNNYGQYPTAAKANAFDLTDVDMAASDFTMGTEVFSGIQHPSDGYTCIIYVNDTTALSKVEGYNSAKVSIAVTNGGKFLGHAAYTADGTLAAPSKAGYEFGGWYTTENFSDSSVTTATGNTVYYAKWVESNTLYSITTDTTNPNVASITAKIDGAQVTKTYVGYVVEVTATANDGYVISGITVTDESSNTVIATIDGTTGSFSMPKSNVKVAATTEEKQYTITYTGEESWRSTNPETYKLSTLPLPLIGLTDRVGYNFNGWYLDGNKVEQIPQGTTGDLTLTALWDPIDYTIIFDSNGGSEVLPITQGYQTEITKPEDPTKEGYTFSKWNPGLPGKMPFEGLTTTAVWTLNPPTINSVSEDQTVPWGETVTLDVDVTHELGDILTYQWYNKTQNAEIAGATASTYQVMSDTLATHAYYCVVIADDGSQIKTTTSDEITVTWAEKTGGITITPDFTSLVGGGKVTLTLKTDAEIDKVEVTCEGVTVTKIENGKYSATLDNVDKTYTFKVHYTGTNYDIPDATCVVTVKKLTVSGENLPSGGTINPDTVSFENKISLENAITNKYADEFKGKTKVFVAASLLINNQINHDTPVTFIIDYASLGIDGSKWNMYDFVILHLKENGETEIVTGTPTVNGLKVTSKLSSFAIGYSVKEQPSSSSTPQGSSVWLTESATPTPTETVTPTETTPTSQPTETETKSSGFGVLAVLAGLGAVAVLRRK